MRKRALPAIILALASADHWRGQDIDEQNRSFHAHFERLEDHGHLPRQIGPLRGLLFGSLVQRRLQGDIKRSAHLRNSLIAILAEEG